MTAPKRFKISRIFEHNKRLAVLSTASRAARRLNEKSICIIKFAEIKGRPDSGHSDEKANSLRGAIVHMVAD